MPRHGGAPIPSAGQLLVGTSGYSYKQWKGSFYPEKLPDREMLSFYAKQFSTVEINHSFYRMPTENVLLQWANTVPEGFRFALKVNQQITHIQRLRNCESTMKRFDAWLGQGVDVYAYFKHEDAGKAPAYARQLLEKPR